MTQERRITDKLPGQPLQWDDNAGAARAASPSVAPAAGQAGLDELVTWDAELYHRGPLGIPDARMAVFNGGGFYRVEDVREVFATLAAPVAADTEQATADVENLIATAHQLREVKHWAAQAAVPLLAEIAGRMLKATPLATPADAGAGLTNSGAWQVQIRSGDDWRNVMAWDHGHTIPQDCFQSYAKAAEALATMESQYEEHSFRLHLIAGESPAPVTASDSLVDVLTDFLRREMPAGTVICRPDWWAMKIARAINAGSPAPVTATDTAETLKEARRDLAHVERYLEESNAPPTIRNRTVDIRAALQSLAAACKLVAPVTAEPVAVSDAMREMQAAALRASLAELESFVKDLDDGSVGRAFYNIRADVITRLHQDAVRVPAPADRDAIRDQALEEAASWIEDYQAEGEHVSFSDIAFDMRKLKTHPSASPAAPSVSFDSAMDTGVIPTDSASGRAQRTNNNKGD